MVPSDNSITRRPSLKLTFSIEIPSLPLRTLIGSVELAGNVVPSLRINLKSTPESFVSGSVQDLCVILTTPKPVGPTAPVGPVEPVGPSNPGSP